MRLVCISVLLAIASCATKGENSLLKGLDKISGFQLSPHTRAIAIIDDNTCIPCSQSFSYFLTQSLADSTVQFIIAAEADHLDLTYYINSSRKDIVYDRNKYLVNNKIINGSTMVFVRNGAIDTVITIETKELEGQLAFISQKLSQ